MYTAEIEDRQVFSVLNPNKLHCIGKCTKGNDPSFYESKYFLTSGFRKYEATESLRGLDNITVTFKPVDKFTVPNDTGYDFFKWTATEQNVKKGVADECDGYTIQKDGFVIWTQCYYTDNRLCAGGIDDVFIYDLVTRTDFIELLNEKEHEFETMCTGDDVER